jgi:ribonuclease J
VHVSGHAHRQEQKRMIELTRPRAFVPVHGTLHHLLRHAELARELQVPQVCVIENGDVAVVDDAGIRKVERVAAGRVHVFAGREVPASVLAERTLLASQGVAHVTVPIGPSGALAGAVVLATRGVLESAGPGTAAGAPSAAGIVAGAEKDARAAVDDVVRAALERRAPSPTDDEVADAVRLAVRRSLGRALGFKPLTIVTVVRVA